ncbi:MAG: endo-1,4-beta-xylanase [Terriglobia bacterium]
MTTPRTEAQTREGSLIFRPFFVQSGRGPHLHDYAYASDANGDPFRCDIAVKSEGLTLSSTAGHKKFGVNVRWNAEGFGHLFMTADNGGEFYELPREGRTTTFNLNHELAKSRVARNHKRLDQFASKGWKPSREPAALQDLAEGFLSDASKAPRLSDQCAALSQKSLFYAMWAGESLELDRARADIARGVNHPFFFIGCDARSYFHMDVEEFLARFTELFNYATITHYSLSGTFGDFEAEEGKRAFEVRTLVFNELRRRGIVVEGRPIFWPYKTTTPDWLRRKSFDEVLKYVERHTRAVVKHYGDGMYAWEIVNELHDWANEVQLKPEQLVEVTRLACEVARDTNPNVRRLINNCCLFGDYIQRGKWTDLDAKYPQRSPYQFVRDLVDAGVDFNITGVQMYFPARDLADTILLIERFRDFGRPVQLTEVGASSGPSELSILQGRLGLPAKPYDWHHPWDEETQADWAESLYTLAYSKPYIEAVNWYDLVDPHSFIPNGGLLRSPRGEKKAIFDRLQKLTAAWKKLPA